MQSSASEDHPPETSCSKDVTAEGLLRSAGASDVFVVESGRLRCILNDHSLPLQQTAHLRHFLECASTSLLSACRGIF